MLRTVRQWLLSGDVPHRLRKAYSTPGYAPGSSCGRPGVKSEGHWQSGAPVCKDTTHLKKVAQRPPVVLLSYVVSKEGRVTSTATREHSRALDWWRVGVQSATTVRTWSCTFRGARVRAAVHSPPSRLHWVVQPCRLRSSYPEQRTTPVFTCGII